MPTKQYSEVLKNIYESAKYYLKVLENGKERITALTYNKSREAILSVINEIENASNKIDSVIKYFIIRCEDITPLALQKLLYYVQSFYYVFTDNFLCEDDCKAWVHGPVCRKVYDC
ncbi:MAG: hypothetical protein PWQ37_1910 [Candidatus Petromonas sp.]|jgi:hypothetical protein|nr:hypothetical protein [Thermoanaerobacterium sp.]MDK2810244.1 hypothetical protein [Petroclostridium sp.]MDK2919177.1 hypothetical protein [Candidatus Petromonas sp.]